MTHMCLNNTTNRLYRILNAPRLKYEDGAIKE